MLATQSKLLNIAVNLQKKKDMEHLRSFNGIPTEFPLNSYVLVQYPKTAFGHKPPTKLHAQWKGPYRVVNFVGPVYTLQNLVTMKNQDVHVSLLKAFEYDPEYTDPAKVALTDKQHFLVEAIRSHSGDFTRKQTLKFLVKWEGYPESQNTFLPWASLRDNEVLHEYLRRDPKLISNIPKDYRTEQDDAIIAEQRGHNKNTRKRRRKTQDY